MVEITLEDKDKKFLVTKAHALVEARYRLSLTEQRIVLTMVSRIEPDDKDFKKYRFKIAEFLRFVGINRPNVYKDMIEITKKLMEKVLTIDLGDGKIHLTHWVQSATYEVGSGYVDITFDPELKPYLLMLKEKFLSYRLQNVIRLKSVYSIRMYELLKQYQKVGRRTFEVANLRKILGLKPSEYKLYGDFKRKIISAAQKDLKKNTDICFDFNEIKTSRKVTDIEFIISVQQQFQDQAVAERYEDAEKKELLVRLKKYFCLTERQAKEVMVQYGDNPEYVAGNLAYVEEQYKLGRVKNIASFTLRALSEDYRPQRTLFDVEKEEKEAAKKQAADEEKKLQGEMKERIAKYVSSLSEDEVDELAREARERALKEGGAIFKDRDISPQIMRGYMYTVAEEKLKTRKAE